MIVLIETLKQCVILEIHLIVVEHDEDTMLAADYIIDIGPGAGIHGGKIVAQGTPEELMKNPELVDRAISSGEKFIPVPLNVVKVSVD